MEINNKLTVTRGGGEGQVNRGCMDTDNGMGIDCGSVGAGGRGEQWVKRWDNCN